MDPNAGEACASTEDEKEMLYQKKVSYCSIIAKPMASRKLAKRCYKLIRTAIQHEGYVYYGLKKVQTRIRKGDVGIVIFAGNVDCIDIMCHLPAVCEEKGVPYVYVPSRHDLGVALGIKKSCLMVLIKEKGDYEAEFEAIKQELLVL